MKNKAIALLTATVLSSTAFIGSVVTGFPNTATAAETSTVSTAAFDAENFFVVVGMSSGCTQLRYFAKNESSGYDVEKVLWQDAPEDISYGEVFVAEEAPDMTLVYPAKDNPVYAHAYYYELADGTELQAAGYCADLMEHKDLTVTSKTYDGSAHWSIRYTDEGGEKTYYYGLSTFASTLYLDPLDCEVGDVYTFALYNDYMVIPLAKNGDDTVESYSITVSQLPDKTIYNIGEELELSGLRLNGGYQLGDLTGCIMDEDYESLIENDVPITVDFSEFDNTIVGVYCIYVYYGNAFDTFTVEVTDGTAPVDPPTENDVTKLTFIDKDTGDLLDIPEGSYDVILTKIMNAGEFSTAQVYNITTNPCVLNEPQVYNPICPYTFYMYTAAGSYGEPEFEVSETDENDIICKVKWTPNGDANGDGEFNVADIVLLQKWLLAVPNVTFADWNAVDYCRDNKLDVFDLCLMKRSLISKSSTPQADKSIITGIHNGMTKYEVFSVLGKNYTYEQEKTLKYSYYYPIKAGYAFDADLEGQMFVEFDLKTNLLVNYGYAFGRIGSSGEWTYPYSEEDLKTAYDTIYDYMSDWYGEGTKGSNTSPISEYLWETDFGQVWAMYGINLWAATEPETYEKGVNEIVLSCSVEGE